MGSGWRVFGLTMRISVLGSAVPTVVTRSSSGSSARDMVMPGDDSVCPYTMVISGMCMRSTTRRMISMGQGDPAITPVRSEVRSQRANSGCSISAIYMAGTPYRAVARSRLTASRVASASNWPEGRMSAAPDTTDTIDPITDPKQWYSGTGAQIRSFSVAFSPMPMAMPLLSRLRWVSMAPLGEPVVPEVASSANGDEVRILHLPSLRFDVLDHPLGASPLYWSLGSSIGYLSRSEPAGIPSGTSFHARNAGRIDFYPHLALSFVAGGWSVVPEAALRETAYTISQTPDLAGANGGTPAISHDPLNRSDFEVSVDLRPPALERDFALTRWNRELRHVIEPEITYRYVSGIGAQERNVLLIDTADIATNTNEVGFSLTQRFYLRPSGGQPCAAPEGCPAPAREWASWQIAQKLFIDPSFGGALIAGRRNVFDSTLDLSPVAFLTSPRNLSPITSRLRFEAIDNLRVQWDMDYDPKAGRMGADNLFAGYSWGRTTAGIGHSLLNAVDETGSAASIIQSQQVQPFLSIGKPSGTGFNLAANGGYDFVHGALQYAGVQAIYNWNCCGLSFGYRRFALGSVRDETQWLYSFTLANFGSVGDIRRSNTAFRDPSQPPPY